VICIEPEYLSHILVRLRFPQSVANNALLVQRPKLRQLDFNEIFWITPKWIVHRPYGRQHGSDIGGFLRIR